MDGDELRLSRAYFEYADGNRAHAPAATSTFAFRLCVTHAAGSSARAESVSDFCNWDDGFLAGCDRITENALNLRPTGKIFVQ